MPPTSTNTLRKKSMYVNRIVVRNDDILSFKESECIAISQNAVGCILLFRFSFLQLCAFYGASLLFEDVYTYFLHQFTCWLKLKDDQQVNPSLRNSSPLFRPHQTTTPHSVMPKYISRYVLSPSKTMEWSKARTAEVVCDDKEGESGEREGEMECERVIRAI